ncbi:hypothetical protein BH18ACT2_BH18ACT2_05870 [soil metagenome]
MSIQRPGRSKWAADARRIARRAPRSVAGAGRRRARRPPAGDRTRRRSERRPACRTADGCQRRSRSSPAARRTQAVARCPRSMASAAAVTWRHLTLLSRVGAAWRPTVRRQTSRRLARDGGAPDLRRRLGPSSGDPSSQCSDQESGPAAGQPANTYDVIDTCEGTRGSSRDGGCVDGLSSCVGPGSRWGGTPRARQRAQLIPPASPAESPPPIRRALPSRQTEWLRGMRTGCEDLTFVGSRTGRGRPSVSARSSAPW